MSFSDGNRENLRAPAGKFRVIGVDTFEGPREDYLIGDYDNETLAIEVARGHAGEMNPVYVYDPSGKCVWKGGTF